MNLCRSEKIDLGKNIHYIYSIMKKWLIYPQKSNNIIEQLLINRGVKNKEQFLNPNYEKDLHNPFLLKGMGKAVRRIQEALKQKEKIGIFADYDADGIPGAALLFRTFKSLGCISEVYIPVREEGYGLNEKGIRELANKGCKLLITVDLGVVNNKEIKLAKRLGMDTIICDHHEIQKSRIPQEAIAVLHPALSKSYPNKNLAGGGVAFKLSQAISAKLTKPSLNELKWLLELPAISTVCDCVELKGENRTMVKYGMVVLSKTKNLGLQELYRTAVIDPKNINTYTIGFQIGPRINAPGRMDHAAPAFRLLTTENREEAKKIAQELNRINYKRQQQLDQVLAEAEEKIKKRKLDKNKMILVEGKNWPMGIIGLVAGKIMEKYSRPVIVFRQEEKLTKGSARSIDGFHILQALERAKGYLLKHGGHAQAAGVTLENKHLSTLYDKLLEIAEAELKFEDLVPKISIDAVIEPEDINFELYNQIRKFEPYGIGNPRPVFLMKGVKIISLRLVGVDKKHLKFLLASPDQNMSFDAIGFDLHYFSQTLQVNDKIDVVFTIDEDTWNGQKKLQLKILDLKKIN